MQGVPPPMTPPKTPSKNVCFESWERFLLTKTTSPNGEKRSLRSKRYTPERNRYQGDAIKPTSIRSPVHSQESDSYLVDFSTLSYADASHTTTPIGASRLSRTLLHPQISQQQARGRLGQVVRNFVKRMLPPSPGGEAFARSTSCPRARHTGNAKGACGESPSARTCQTEMTPRSDASGESAWTFASARSWIEAGAQGCLDYQATNRWSGFWH